MILSDLLTYDFALKTFFFEIDQLAYLLTYSERGSELRFIWTIPNSSLPFQI